MKEIPLSSKLNGLIYFAGNCFIGYPYCRSKDPAFFEYLLEEFAELDVLQELKLYYTWTLDLTEIGPIPYRTMFRVWLNHSCSLQSTRPFTGKDLRC